MVSALRSSGSASPVPAGRDVHQREVRQDLGDDGLPRADTPLRDVERAVVELLCPCVVPSRLEGLAQVVEQRDHLDVIGAVRLFRRLHGFAE
jgi:hypothetical protein